MTGRFARFAIAAIILAAAASAAPAHELRPAYLELRELDAETFSVLWKVPRVGDATLSLRPQFSDANADARATRTTGSATVSTWTARGRLRGEKIRIDGLETTLTDALVRVEFADGSSLVRRLDAREPRMTVPERESAVATAATYLRLGVEHILTGPDHLLFVLCLVLVTGWRRSLVRAVTAFTAAHTLTLGLATLGVVHVPQAPVEAVIALSVAFIAAEVARGAPGERTLRLRSPWLVAFAFGLLHGFGFAGALGEVGLPPAHIPLALVLFNTGVEIGQLLFLLAVWAASRVIVRAIPSVSSRTRWTTVALPYAIGTIAMFWVVERVAAF